ncbi:hypothetical protein COCOBI_06-6140 [Coccomyxa sp. Obi]|nr:hypothetical protein COCOBI_06-6140 [Coccomyxa sp. Obi]
MDCIACSDDAIDSLRCPTSIARNHTQLALGSESKDGPATQNCHLTTIYRYKDSLRRFSRLRWKRSPAQSSELAANKQLKQGAGTTSACGAQVSGRTRVLWVIHPY